MDRVVERIHRFGPITFAEALEAALYDDASGFYATAGPDGRAGTRGADFITSPTVGDLFGAVVARALDAWWAELGRPDPFVVVEAGAATGRLARSILRAAPGCSPALRYVLVERSDVLRAAAAASLPLEPPGWVLGPAAPADDDDVEEAGRLSGRGPLVTAIADLPAGPFTGVVLANELLDDIPPRLVERTAETWAEIRVGASGDELVEVPVTAEPELAAEAGRFAPDAAPGARIPIATGACAWLRRAAGTLPRGRIVVFDYADTTASMATRPWRDWLRTYRDHAPGVDPLDGLGQQDVTCEVPIDQLARVRPLHADRDQATFLAGHGLAELVDAARAEWAATAAEGDLRSLAARSRVNEAAALTDPAGLGAFRVLEWTVP